MINARLRGTALACVVVVLVPLAVACASNDGATTTTSSSGGSTTVTTRTGDGSTVTVTSRPAGSTAVAGPRTKLEGFKEVTVTVTTAGGETKQWCLMLADTNELRQRGLMFVEDPSLGGYDGMLFEFQEDSDGGFWMKNTILPLSIAYLKADGTVRKVLDMQPCPKDASTCPSYSSGGPYRYAIEVPTGGLSRLGIGDGAKVEVGTRSCGA